MKPLLPGACLIATLMLSACGGSPPPAPAAVAADSGEATATIGDVTIRASTLQTSSLNEAIARRYGIARDDRTVMLLVAVRKGQGTAETSVPARVTASATGLTGGRRDIPMREQRTGELLDYVGTVDTTLPETLRFEVDVVREDGARSTLRFNREFFPR